MATVTVPLATVTVTMCVAERRLIGLARLLRSVEATSVGVPPDVAVSIPAAEIYYEAMGQNWERAAWIKARQCAGDSETGALLLKHMVPFVWRRNLDYAAIQDIHSIKRQIHSHGGHERIAVAGHNIKLGRGGIREIEFFVQTQQLILGGREPALRHVGPHRRRGELLVLDCGVGSLHRLMEAGYDANQVRHVLITHHHQDHTAELGNFAGFGWSSGATAATRSDG